MRLKVAMAFSAALAVGASPAAAQEEARWKEVLSDSAQVVSIDTASVIALGDSVYRVWEGSASRTSSEGRVLARADFDCRLRLTRTVAVVLPGFAPVRGSEEEFEWTEIVPGSRFEAEFRRVCPQ